MHPKFRRIVIHLGAEKTGTTSFQAFLGRNRAALRARGILVPNCFVPDHWNRLDLANHFQLAACCLPSLHPVRDMAHLLPPGLPASLADRQAEFRARLHQEAQGLDPAAHDLVLSSEHLHSRATEFEEMQALAQFAASLATTTDLVFAIRPQHEMAISLLAMCIRQGGTRLRAIPVFEGPERWDTVLGVRDRYFDLGRTAYLLRLAAPQARLLVRNPYGPGQAGDSIADLCAAAGIDPQGLARPAPQNTSPSFEALAAMLAINRACAARGTPLPEPEALAALLARLAPGPGIGMAPPERQAFMAQFAEGNEYLRQTFFPGHDTLFAEPTRPLRTIAELDAATPARADLLCLALAEAMTAPERRAQ